MNRKLVVVYALRVCYYTFKAYFLYLQCRFVNFLNYNSKDLSYREIHAFIHLIILYRQDFEIREFPVPMMIC